MIETEQETYQIDMNVKAGPGFVYYRGSKMKQKIINELLDKEPNKKEDECPKKQ
jgi:hypothetical protein